MVSVTGLDPVDIGSNPIASARCRCRIKVYYSWLPTKGCEFDSHHLLIKREIFYINNFITCPVKPRPSGRGYKGLKNVTF